MGDTPQDPKDKAEPAVKPAGAEQSVAQDIYKPPGEKQSGEKSAAPKPEPHEKTVSERVCDEAYHIWLSATGWFGSERKGENGAAKQKDKATLEVTNAFKAEDGKDKQPQDAKATQPEERGWWQRTKDFARGAASVITDYFTDAKDFVVNGFEKATTIASDTWSTVIKGKEYQDDVQVIGKVGDGKTKEVMVRTDHDTRQLTADEVRRKDADGNTIIQNRKTGEVISQSADGKTVYQKRADGTEVIHDETGDLIRDMKNHKVTKIDNDGTVTEFKLDKNDPENDQVITKFNDAFKIAQVRSGFAWRHLGGSEGQSTTFGDGSIGTIHRRGMKSVVHNDGTTEVQDREGDTYRVRNGRLEHRNKDGNFIPVRDGDPETKAIERRPGGGWRINGVDVDQDGTVHGVSGEKIQKTENGVKLEGTDSHGRTVTATVDGDGKSVVTDGKGSKTTFDPNNPEHLVTRTDEQGRTQYDYNADTGRFRDEQNDIDLWYDWTELDYMDVSIFEDGSIQLDDGSFLVDAREEAYEQAGQTANSAVQQADAACAAAIAEVANGTCDFGDVSTVINALGDLNNALGVAMAAGNFDAINAIVMKKGQLEGVLGDVRVRAQVAAELASKGITDPTSLSEAQDRVGTTTVAGLVNEEQRQLGKAV